MDAVWIENMNTVLDDNKKLCLANSDQIKMTDKMSIIFEVQDLAEASLATVSRCGMIYMEARQLPIKYLYENWYHSLPKLFQTVKQKEYFDLIFDHLFKVALKVLNQEGIQKSTESSEHHLLMQTLRLFESHFFKLKNRQDMEDDLRIQREKEESRRKTAALIGDENFTKEEPEQGKKKTPAAAQEEFGKNEKTEFFAAAVYALTWGIGSVVNISSRDKFSECMLDEIKTNSLTIFKGLPEEVFPGNDEETNLFDSFYSLDSKNWQLYQKQITSLKIDPSTKFNDLFIPTKDSIRNEMILRMLIRQCYPVLFNGKTGTAKTKIIKNLILNELDSQKYIPVITVLSANTERSMLQDVFESKLEKQKRSKGVYGPLMGKKNIIFIDDLNMPKKEDFGAQPPLELLR